MNEGFFLNPIVKKHNKGALCSFEEGIKTQNFNIHIII